MFPATVAPGPTVVILGVNRTVQFGQKVSRRFTPLGGIALDEIQGIAMTAIVQPALERLIDKIADRENQPPIGTEQVFHSSLLLDRRPWPASSGVKSPPGCLLDAAAAIFAPQER